VGQVNVNTFEFQKGEVKNEKQHRFQASRENSNWFWSLRIILFGFIPCLQAYLVFCDFCAHHGSSSIDLTDKFNQKENNEPN
jgi:hypothetical protein